MQIEDIVGARFGIGNEVDMEDGNRGWNLEDTAEDSLTLCVFFFWCEATGGGVEAHAG
jgi:hypothetical protein